MKLKEAALKKCGNLQFISVKLDLYSGSINHVRSMRTTTRINQIFAIHVWNDLPLSWQKFVSKIASLACSWKISSFFIIPFCQRYHIDQEHLQLYLPNSGAKEYKSFQDFFTRKLKTPMQINPADVIAPCQGFVCENGLVADFTSVVVKGQTYTIRNIFNDSSLKIKDSFTFMNIFLHNHNYHRFHAPVSGTVLNIEFIPGQLNFLRPWFYSIDQVSSPSFVNERCIVEIQDAEKRSWFLSFVAGMGVGHIKLSEGLAIGSSLAAGDEIGYFLLGSTCCIAAPLPLKKFSYMQKIELGEQL